MPIYEYACKKCGKVVESFQKASDPGPKTCAKCGGRLGRVISHTSFQLKGGGWYKDLYASAKPESGSSSDGEAKAESKADGDTKTEAKVEAKPEAKADAKSDAKPEAKTEAKPAKTEPKKASKEKKPAKTAG
jgi:putative FmdB family regulatory protein